MILNWMRILRLSGVLAVFAVVVGCSVLTQDQKTALSVSPSGVVSIEATGYRPGNVAMRFSVDPETGVVDASLFASKDSLYRFLDSQTTKYKELRALPSGP